MKCPKCGYLGFESVDRCRNCGYDFSLAQEPSAPDLPIRRAAAADAPLRLDDLSLTGKPARAVVDTRFEAESRADLDRLFAMAQPQENRLRGAASEPATADGELPLFGGAAVDDEPLITRASAPRTPLSVRRATPEVPRLKSDAPRPAMLDLDMPVAGLPVRTSAPRRPAALSADPGADSVEDATLAARFVAVAVDLLILGAVDVVVVYFTMQICGLTLQDVGMLPRGPLLAFLLVQNGGYLVAFTAGGQTLGKMAAGVRVVANEAGAAVDLGRAVVRELVWLLLAIPAGLGFLTAVFSADHRGLHDRFAGTRVVRG